LVLGSEGWNASSLKAKLMRSDRLFLLGLVVSGCFTAVLLMVIVVGKLWFFDYYHVPNAGMSPTIPERSFVFVWRRPYGSVGNVQRGDIVAFVQESDGGFYTLISRVVGLPGDTVTLVDDEVAVNKKVLHRELETGMKDDRLYREAIDNVEYSVVYDVTVRRETQPRRFQVPAGHVFVMGDNRGHSLDSEEYGPVPFSSVIAKVVWHAG
jgi:signal peptidase I